MRSCCGCSDVIKSQFTPKRAAQELKRYRTRGPDVTTRFLRDGLLKARLAHGTLLDVGAGVGALTFELLDKGVTRAIAVDASPAYLEAAEQEARRRHQSQSISFVQGDFVSLAPQLSPADTVTLDRVICCYPDYKPMLIAALQHASRAFAFSYPRDRWFVKLAVRAENALRRVRSNPFRTVVHPVDEMHRLIRAASFEMVSRTQTATWAADVYARTDLRG